MLHPQPPGSVPDPEVEGIGADAPASRNGSTKPGTARIATRPKKTSVGSSAPQPLEDAGDERRH
jgi:hypothetical protein